MLMQAYDFLVLYKKYGCCLQLGGNDQWSNILAGADLIRRHEKKDAYAMTFTLLETSDGQKMGKTQKGALWLDAGKTTPYEFYQYFRNVEDAKVNECLKLLTFMELDEIEELTREGGEKLNHAKKRLAFEVTKLVHGEVLATEAEKQAAAAFGGGDATSMPSVTIEGSSGTSIVDVLVLAGVVKSKSEARQIIAGGGVKIGEVKVESHEQTIENFTSEKEFILHKGKKVHIRVIIK